MRTVFTPEALQRSVEKGGFKTCLLKEWKEVDGDEAFLFIYPSVDPINEVNGDGDFVEIIDFNRDLTLVDLDGGGSVKTTPETRIYYR